MFLAIVQHVAALAERAEVSRAIVAGVMVEMRSGQEDPGGEPPLIAGEGFRKLPQRAAAAVAPHACILVPPAPIAEVEDHATVRAAALLAAPFCATKPDRGRDLRPVDRVQPAILGADRHL